MSPLKTTYSQLMPQNQPLLATQLTIKHKLQALVEKLELNHATTESGYSALFLKLIQFEKKVVENSANCYLLAAHYDPQVAFSQIQSLPLYSTEDIFGHFQPNSAQTLEFIATDLLSQTTSIQLSAALLLQNQTLTKLLVKTLAKRQFESRWLSSNNAESLLKAQHKSIKVDFKLVIFGDENQLSQLLEHWPLLEKLTRATVYETDLVCSANQNTLTALVNLVKHRYQFELSSEQVCSLGWALSRYTEDQQYLSLEINYLDKLFDELNADFSPQEIEQGVKKLHGGDSHAKTFNYQQILTGSVKLDVSGEVVGQINGLTVVETSNAEFGEPSRITANVYIGDGDIGDIERKADLAGNIHAKAMMILSSYVNKTFAKLTPLPISANIVFEQSYHEVDGDSASVAELYALLSAITNIPIFQHVAITGAMDQHGNVQAVGGLDLKIESFIELACQLSPDCRPTIIIPASNIENLNLTREVVAAVESKQVEIVAIKHVTEAARLLTGLPATAKEADNLYDRVMQSLDKMDADTPAAPSLKQKLLSLFKLSSN